MTTLLYILAFLIALYVVLSVLFIMWWHWGWKKGIISFESEED